MSDASRADAPFPDILIVEDDPDNCETLGEILEIEGYRVVKAIHGQEALDLLIGGFSPCLILLDLMMPVMDGWEFRRQQKANPALATIPVIVMSGDGRIEQKSQAVEAEGFVIKPIVIEALLEEIRRCCK